MVQNEKSALHPASIYDYMFLGYTNRQHIGRKSHRSSFHAHALIRFRCADGILLLCRQRVLIVIGYSFAFPLFVVLLFLSPVWWCCVILFSAHPHAIWRDYNTHTHHHRRINLDRSYMMGRHKDPGLYTTRICTSGEMPFQTALTSSALFINHRCARNCALAPYIAYI